MHRCYHSLSYARAIRWKPLPGTVLGLSLLVHKLNTLSGALAHTHTAEQFLPWGFSNYPQWMGDSRTRRGPTGLSHTLTQDSPFFFQIYSSIFSFHLWLFFPLRSHEVYGRYPEEKTCSGQCCRPSVSLAYSTLLFFPKTHSHTELRYYRHWLLYQAANQSVHMSKKVCCSKEDEKTRTFLSFCCLYIT